jgi:hypothetical protein
MSIGRSREEQELTDLLAKTLVQKEVMEPMSKINWGHGTPPPPDNSGQPAPAEGAPGNAAAPAAQPKAGQPAPTPAAPGNAGSPKADTPKIEDLIAVYESMRDPETGLIARKYATVTEAIKGGVHLTHMAKQAFSEADSLRKQLAEMNDRLRQAPAPTPGGVVPQPKPELTASRARVDEAQAKYDKVLSDITENGGVLDADSSKAMSRAQRDLSEAIADSRAQEVASSRNQQEEADRAAWDEVDQHMKTKYPGSERFSEEIALNLQSDPLLASAVDALFAKGKRLQATELAWKGFAQSHGDQIAATAQTKAEEKEVDLAAREQVRKEAVERARRDAGVVTGSAGGAGAHENQNASGPTREHIDQLREAMRREGDSPGSPAAAAFRRAIIPLDPSIFGPQ